MSGKQKIQAMLLFLAVFGFILGWMKYYQVGFFDSDASNGEDLQNYPLPDAGN